MTNRPPPPITPVPSSSTLPPPFVLSSVPLPQPYFTHHHPTAHIIQQQQQHQQQPPPPPLPPPQQLQQQSLLLMPPPPPPPTTTAAAVAAETLATMPPPSVVTPAPLPSSTHHHPSPLLLAAPPPPPLLSPSQSIRLLRPTLISRGCNTIHQQQSTINPYDYNSGNGNNNTTRDDVSEETRFHYVANWTKHLRFLDRGGVAVPQTVTNNSLPSSSSCLHRLHQLEERNTVTSGMTSTIVVNNSNHDSSSQQSQQQYSYVDNEITAEVSHRPINAHRRQTSRCTRSLSSAQRCLQTMPTPPTTSRPRNDVDVQTEKIVTNDKVVSVCKQTIMNAIHKIIVSE